MLEQKKNYVFLGEAGSGKSEVAMNFALQVREISDRPVHFFDMDMTKPLFRSRDAVARMEKAGILFHYEKQFADAPTMVGGVRVRLKDPDSIVIMDVGGDYIGARAVGGFSEILNMETSAVIYVVNVYRPWSSDINAIDRTMGEILGVAHILPEQLLIAANPNVGENTVQEEFEEGWKKTEKLIRPYSDIAFACAKKELAEKAEACCRVPVLPMNLYLPAGSMTGEQKGEMNG